MICSKIPTASPSPQGGIDDAPPVCQPAFMVPQERPQQVVQFAYEHQTHRAGPIRIQDLENTTVLGGLKVLRGDDCNHVTKHKNYMI